MRGRGNSGLRMDCARESSLAVRRSSSNMKPIESGIRKVRYKLQEMDVAIRAYRLLLL